MAPELRSRIKLERKVRTHSLAKFCKEQETQLLIKRPLNWFPSHPKSNEDPGDPHGVKWGLRRTPRSSAGCPLGCGHPHTYLGSLLPRQSEGRSSLVMLAGSPGDGRVTGLLAWGELRVGVASVESRCGVCGRGVSHVHPTPTVPHGHWMAWKRLWKFETSHEHHRGVRRRQKARGCVGIFSCPRPPTTRRGFQSQLLL